MEAGPKQPRIQREHQSGSIARYRDGWRAAYMRVVDGKTIRRSKTFRPPRTLSPAKKEQWLATGEKEAEKWLRSELADLDRGKLPTANETLSEWLDRWLPVQRANTEPGTWKRDEEVIRSLIRSQIGGIKLSLLTGSRINTWLSELYLAEKSDDERQRAWATLRKILRAHDTYPRANLDTVRPPTVRRPEALFLDPEQYVRLATTAESWSETHPYLHAMVRVGVECCCRPREWLAILWEDYDQATGIVRIRRALTTRGKGGHKPPKTERSARDVPLSPTTKAVLDQWRANAPETEWMFPAPGGGHWWYSRFRRTVWPDLVKAAGLPDHTPKCIRHAGASLLLAAGGSLLAVTRRMGHSSPHMILRVYGHTMRDDQRKLADLFETIAKKPITNPVSPQNLPTIQI